MIPIPCDTIARMAHLLHDDSPWPYFRLDHGKVIATDGQFMAVEIVSPFEGVFHVLPDSEMIEQCRREAVQGGLINFTPVAAISYTTAITTHGVSLSQNLGYFGDVGDLALWYERIVEPTLQPVPESTGPLAFDVDGLTRLAQTSPSGRVVTEATFDPERRATVVRDTTTMDWVGFFRPRLKDHGLHVPAAVPGWLVR